MKAQTRIRGGFHEVDALGPAFLGLQLYLLLAVIDRQGTKLLRTHGSRIPSRLASTLALVNRLGPLSVTELGEHLGMSHQLTAHRVDALRRLGLLVSKPDRQDQRRMLLRLTARGAAEARRLEAVCRVAAAAYRELFDELGCDLFTALVGARQALDRRSFDDRTRARRPARAAAKRRKR